MEQKDYRLAAILYTDIVGFSRMMETDEAGTLKILSVHNTLIEERVAVHQGTVIKTIGDAYMVSFRNTVQALQCAIEIQDAIYDYNLSKEAGSKLLLRIGLHLGDIYFYENDALGEGINIAARLQSFAKPGCICFSQDVFNQVINKIDFHAEKLGRVSLKNITKEIHAYEIETKNVEFDHEKTTRNRKITDGQPSPKTFPVGDTAFDDRKQSAKQGDSSSQNDAEEQHGSAAQYDDTRQHGTWSFETDGQRLGSELNRALHGLMSIAEQKLSGFINSVENGVGGTAGHTPQSGHFGGAVNRSSENKLSTEDRWKQWVAEKNSQAEKHGAVPYSAYSGYGDDFQQHRVQNVQKSQAPQNRREFSFEDIRLNSIDTWEKNRRGLAAHIVSYITVNAGLWFINIHSNSGVIELSDGLRQGAAEVTQGLAQIPPEHMADVPDFVLNFGDQLTILADQVAGIGFFPWAAIVSCSWGIGLVSHILEVHSLKKTKKELEQIDDLPEEAWRIYRRMDKSRRGMVQHTASAFTVSLLLITINALTSPLTPWSAIPAGILLLIWFIRLLGHGSAIRSFKRRLCDVMGVDRWRDLFSGKGRRRRAQPTAETGYAAGQKTQDSGASEHPQSAHSAEVTEAEKLRESIVSILRKKGDELPLETDTEETLDSYVGQIRLLASSLDELDAIITSVPVNLLKKDRIELTVKMRNTESGELKREYEKSIDEIAKQEEAHRKVREQREALELRLTSSVHALKRIQMDALRLSVDSSALAGEAIFTRIQQNSDELSQYIEDIQSGYQDTDRYLEEGTQTE